MALEVRSDGSATAKWPDGKLAVSVDVDDGTTAAAGAGATLYRVMATARESRGRAPSVTFDAMGAGSVHTLSGTAVLSAMEDGSGYMADPRTGAFVRQWDAHGNVFMEAPDADAVKEYTFDGSQGGVFRMAVGKHLGVRYTLSSRRLELFFKCGATTHFRLVHGRNHADTVVVPPGKSLFGDKSVARSGAAGGGAANAAPGAAPSHHQQLAQIRAAVGGL